MKLIRFLKGELAAEAQAWVADGVIGEEQAAAILARYGARFGDAPRAPRGYLVLLSLAAVMAGVGLILLLSHNWEQIPHWLRLGGIGALLALINAQGLRAWWQGREKIARVWLLFGAIWYGAAIFLVAQIYHLGEHYPEGLLLWAAGITPIALLTRSRALAWLSIVVGSAWMVVETVQGGYPWLYPALLGALAFFALYQQRSTLLFLALCVALGSFLEVSLFHWAEQLRLEVDELSALLLASSLFLCYQHLALWLQRDRGSRWWSDYGAALDMWTLRYLLVALVVLSFPASWESLNHAEPLEPLNLWLLIGSLALVGLLVAASVPVQRLARSTVPAEVRARVAHRAAVLAPALFYAFFLSAALILLGAWMPDLEVVQDVALLRQVEEQWQAFATLCAVITNAFILGAGIWLIVRGVQSKATMLYYSGILLLLATGVGRYVDLIGDYIGGAVIFFTAAGVLWGAARLWRRSIGPLAEDAQNGRARHAA